MGKPLSIWMSEEEIKELKAKSEKEKRSVSNFIRLRLFEKEKKKCIIEG